MDNERIQIFEQAMETSERLKILAQLQATYRDELLQQEFEAEIVSQLVIEWSRIAFTMTIPREPDQVDESFDEIARRLGLAKDESHSDPSSVPEGEAWLIESDEEAAHSQAVESESNPSGQDHDDPDGGTSIDEARAA